MSRMQTGLCDETIFAMLTEKCAIFIIMIVFSNWQERAFMPVVLCYQDQRSLSTSLILDQEQIN